MTIWDVFEGRRSDVTFHTYRELAGFTSLLPLGGEQYGVYGASVEHDVPGGGRSVFRYVVTPGYFDAMGIEIRHGRALEEHDGTGTKRSVVISESLAKSRFPG